MQSKEWRNAAQNEMTDRPLNWIGLSTGQTLIGLEALAQGNKIIEVIGTGQRLD